MPIRNPFRKAGADTLVDENARPVSYGGTDRGFQKADPVGLKPTSAVDIKVKEPAEYKLSGMSAKQINDSGVYLPPSPPERKPFWHSRSSGSISSSNHRSIVSENEPFNISRESFDSYRRSFDISARSPVIDPDHRSRASFDFRRARLPPRASIKETSFKKPEATAEEGFEDVGLNDDAKPKKRGLFARFGDSSDNTNTPTEGKPVSSHLPFHFTGRKRGQSGTGAELGNINKPTNAQEPDGRSDA